MTNENTPKLTRDEAAIILAAVGDTSARFEARKMGPGLRLQVQRQLTRRGLLVSGSTLPVSIPTLEAAKAVLS